jgi:cell division protein ZapA
MANVNIKFNGKDYLLSCDDGQEENLKELANHLSKKFNELKSNLGNIGENKLLLISSIKVIDEYYDLVKKIESKKKEFNNLSEKFKELKSLVIDYKADKDNEISKLKEDLGKFKTMADENKDIYEKMLDTATESIEKFIQSSSKDKRLQ